MSVVAVLQARVSSSRLPSKVLSPINGVPMLVRQIDRIKKSTKIDHIIVATSDDPSDDLLESSLSSFGTKVFRGDLNNVLKRFIDATADFTPTHVVRLTGDCPLIDANIIDKVINTHLVKKSDYTSNCFPPTYPDGQDVEVIRYEVLADAYKNASLPSEKEHVTLYITNRIDQYRSENVEYIKDLGDQRWTVDYPEDLALIEEIFKHFKGKEDSFTMEETLDFLKTTNLSNLNKKYARNEGLQKSLEEDKKFQEK